MVKGESGWKRAGTESSLDNSHLWIIPCFLYNMVNAGNFISGSSAFSKYSLFISKFLVHVLLKQGLKDFDHNLVSM